MTEKHPEKTHKTHQGFISLTIFTGLKILIISTLAWLCLLIWFIGEIFCKGQSLAIESAKTMAANNLCFIQNNPAFLAESLLTYLNKIQFYLDNLFSSASAWDNHWLQY